MAVIECSQCGEMKAESEFRPARGTGQVKKKRACKVCYGVTQKEAKKRWVERNPEKVKESRRKWMQRTHHKRLYGITDVELIRQYLLQDFKCAICNESIAGEKNVDHDHKTGKNRGLLCPKCNRGLGLFNDDATNLRLAAAYLDRGGVWQ